MDTIVVGIDVSKDRLDVSVQPAGTALSYNRDAVGIEGLIEALAPLAPQLVAVEATGGFEAVVAASLAAPSTRVYFALGERCSQAGACRDIAAKSVPVGLRLVSDAVLPKARASSEGN